MYGNLFSGMLEYGDGLFGFSFGSNAEGVDPVPMFMRAAGRRRGPRPPEPNRHHLRTEQLGGGIERTLHATKGWRYRRTAPPAAAAAMRA